MLVSKCQDSVLHYYLLWSLRLGDSNNGQGLPDLEGHILYDHTLSREKGGGNSDTVRYCVEILLDLTRSNYYCSFRRKKQHSSSRSQVSNPHFILKTCVFSYTPIDGIVNDSSSFLSHCCHSPFSSVQILAEAKNAERIWGMTE